MCSCQTAFSMFNYLLLGFANCMKFISSTDIFTVTLALGWVGVCGRVCRPCTEQDTINSGYFLCGMCVCGVIMVKNHRIFMHE